MSAKLQTDMQAIVERLDPSHRDLGERDIKAIEEAGAESFEDLLSIVRDSQAAVDLRGAVAWVLGRLGKKEALPALLIALQDSDPQLRQAAAQALGELAGMDMGTVVTADTADTADTSKGSGSADKLVVKHLGELLIKDEGIEVRKAAAYALGLAGQDEGVVLLLHSLSNPQEDAAVRGMSAEALATIGIASKEVITTLIGALDDPSVEVRYWAAFSLGELGDASSLPHLERLAASDRALLPDHGTVGGEAAESIKQIMSKINKGVDQAD